MKTSIWLALICAFAVQSIALAASKPDQAQPNYRLDVVTGKGLMVVSMTMPKFHHGHLHNLRWQLFYRAAAAKPQKRPGKAITLEHENFLTGRNIANDFGAEMFGVLFAVELPAGSYELTKWYLDANTTATNLESINAKPLGFEIHAGRATYVGNLDMKVRAGENILGIEVLGDARVTISDEVKRDTEIFLRKFPQLSRDQVDNGVTTDISWQNAPRISVDPPPFPITTSMLTGSGKSVDAT